jgi:thermostable 8-oxoguanine DNA glycosylase
MINVTNITDFDRTESELQEYFLFCTCVAGKTAYIQSQKLESFLQPAWFRTLTPFEYIRELVANDKLRLMIMQAKLGQYTRLSEIFKQSVTLDLETATVEDLEKIPGIGPKTSRFFMIHSRPNQRYAVLDTHILSWLQDNVEDVTVPRTTPQSIVRYRKLENLFLIECDKRGISPETFDLEICM